MKDLFSEGTGALDLQDLALSERGVTRADPSMTLERLIHNLRSVEFSNSL